MDHDALAFRWVTVGVDCSKGIVYDVYFLWISGCSGAVRPRHCEPS